MNADYESGRLASAEELVSRLGSASQDYLDGALANERLQPQHLLLILRSRSVTGPLLARIGRSPVWMRLYKLRAALVQHPKAPRGVAMSLVSSLRWADLARLAASARSPVAVRAAAERILVLRLPELTLGERVSLARVATVPVLQAMRRDSSALVVKALLENPLLRYEEAVSMAERADAPAPLLKVLAECPRFAGRRELRLALAAHPHTPAPVALRFVAVLPADSLAFLAQSAKTPVLVRLAAERRLGRDGASSAQTSA